MSDDLSSFSMAELFRVEAENQAAVLTAGLLALERNPTAADRLEECMRAAHSLKGAGRIVNLNAAVRIAHAMEDRFVAAQSGHITLNQTQIDVLLDGVDLMTRISKTPESETDKWETTEKDEIDQFLAQLLTATESKAPLDTVELPIPEPPPAAAVRETASGSSANRVLRVTADRLDRLLGLAGESLVESGRLKPFTESLLRLKRMQYDLSNALSRVSESLADHDLDETRKDALAIAQRSAVECHRFLSDRLVELELFDHRAVSLAHNFYDEALTCRMRPFADGVQGFPRMVRDLARACGKETKLEIIGEAVSVDRDILEKLEAPLTHLLRNAVDHGIELPEERLRAGKPREGTVRLEARHSAGMLLLIVSDDGRGLPLEKLREAVVYKKLTTAEIAAQLAEAELLEFLFLPGFTMKTEVTEISGRGVGLDVVQSMIRQVRGTVRVTTTPGKGMSFQLQVPLTLSIIRTVLAEIGGEPYAFPLAHITRTMKIPREKIEMLEGRQHFQFEGRQIGLVMARQVFGQPESALAAEEWPVIVTGNHHHTYGLVVDRFMGERELVVQPLDPRLGKVKDISAGALMDDGSPVLIADLEDIVRSVDKLVSGGTLAKVRPGKEGAAPKRKRVLVVDDSLTVRELERKLLSSRGYEVEVAVDGMDGWNAVRTGQFNLVVTDVDMPRLDGIELVTLIKKDVHLKSLPVMIVSYKDRAEDRSRGLEAGADFYLTKGSFHDETLLNAVTDLIGGANE